MNTLVISVILLKSVVEHELEVCLANLICSLPIDPDSMSPADYSRQMVCPSMGQCFLAAEHTPD